MREIKFRGKCERTGEWVYGYMGVTEMGKHYIDSYEILSSGLTIKTHSIVIPKTVGQFTRIKDKNGKEIYEWDIVKNGMSGDWIIQPLEEGAMSLLGISAQYKGSNYDISALNENVEVIGNIHDKNTEQ